jgi:1-acyl-sn-glycerol-3-phosphate acyltransferase
VLFICHCNLGNQFSLILNIDIHFGHVSMAEDVASGVKQKGAFTVAAKGGVPVVPISLIGSGKLMPNGLEGTLRPGKIKVVVHPPLRGSSADQLCEDSRKIIAETLTKHGLPVH